MKTLTFNTHIERLLALAILDVCRIWNVCYDDASMSFNGHKTMLTLPEPSTLFDTLWTTATTTPVCDAKEEKEAFRIWTQTTASIQHAQCLEALVYVAQVIEPTRYRNTRVTMSKEEDGIAPLITVHHALTDDARVLRQLFHAFDNWMCNA